MVRDWNWVAEDGGFTEIVGFDGVTAAIVECVCLCVCFIRVTVCVFFSG